MCRGELSAAIERLMSKCLRSGWKRQWGVKEIPSLFPCSPVVREWLWKKTQIAKKKKKKNKHRHFLLQAWLSEQLLFPKSFYFGVFSLALVIFRGTAVFRNSSTVKRIYLKHQIFCKGNIFFSKDHLESSILQSSVSFYLKRTVAAGHSFLQTYWLLLEDQLELSM